MSENLERRRATDRERQRRWVAANRERRRERDRAAYAASPEKKKQSVKKDAIRLRSEVLSAYGSLCACCGTTSDLSIDHIDGGGGEHRAAVRRKGGAGFYRWLKDNGFPDGYQTLCVPCNTSKGGGARCAMPHADRAAAAG